MIASQVLDLSLQQNKDGLYLVGLNIFSVYFVPLSVPSLYLAVIILRCPALCSSVFNKLIAFLMILSGELICLPSSPSYCIKLFCCRVPLPSQHVPLHLPPLASPHFRGGRAERGFQSLFSVPVLR